MGVGVFYQRGTPVGAVAGTVDNTGATQAVPTDTITDSGHKSTQEPLRTQAVAPPTTSVPPVLSTVGYLACEKSGPIDGSAPATP